MFLLRELSEVKQSFQRCHTGGNPALTGPGLLQTRQSWEKKVKTPSKILTTWNILVTKKEHASTIKPVQKRSLNCCVLGLKFQLLLSSSPRELPAPNHSGLLPRAFSPTMGDVPASTSIPASLGVCFPQPCLPRGRSIRIDVLGVPWMWLLEAGGAGEPANCPRGTVTLRQCMHHICAWTPTVCRQ